MLVLSRRLDEGFVIFTPDGTAVVCRVVEIRRNGGRVKIGIDAPDDVQIARLEPEPEPEEGGVR